VLIEGDMEGSQGGLLLLLSHPCDKISPKMVTTPVAKKKNYLSFSVSIRAEGKGRSMQQLHKILKFEKHSHGSPVTILARTHIASLSDYSASKVAKFVVRYKIVHKGQRICIPAVINSRKAQGKVLLP